MSTFAQKTPATQAMQTGRYTVRPAPRARPSEHAVAPPEARGRSLVQLRQALDQSPRVQVQLVLQRTLNKRAPARVVQRAKLNLRQDGTISGVSQWPKRPSSNVSGSQGQHLTAYVSYTDMILSHVRDRTPKQAANALIGVLGDMLNLPGGDNWYGQYGDTIEINKQLLKDAAKNDDADTVGDVIDNILSLRNKMPDTAIATAEQTWGHGESKSSGSLEVLEDIIRRAGGTLPNTYTEKTEANAALFNMWRLLDYQPTTNASSSAFDKTQKRVLRHVMQMRLSYPEVFAWLSARGYWLMPYIKAHRADAGMPLSDLDNTEIGEITDYVHSNL